MTSDMENMGGVARAQDGAREWLGMLQTLAQQIQKQQHNSQQMIQEMMDTYMQLLNTPGSYFSSQAEQQQQTVQQQAQQQQQSFQQMTQEVLNTYTQLFNIPLSYAQEGLRGAQFPIAGYDELTVDEVSSSLGDLSAEDLRVVRDYEERNK